MRVSLEWLADFVEVPDPGEVARRLTAAGVEVEEIIDPRTQVHGVVVVEVRAVEPHPKADRLKLCRVFDGEQEHTVVCGAPNVAAGRQGALAKVGASLPGLKVGARKIRGIKSHGMLCAKNELGLEEDSDGIWQLKGLPLGADVLDAVGVAPVLEISVTPNRPDLLSHQGIAREVAAALGTRSKSWTGKGRRVSESGPDVMSLGRVAIDDARGCKRYVGRVIQNLKVGPSPDWLVRRLQAIGQRPINNVVDATNYVLFELGHPMHAFDLARLAGEGSLPMVRVRRAKKGERLTTLDGVDRVLDLEDLIIADARQPVALAGVMGGAGSEVSQTTTSVLLESAFFDPICVRRTARRHGLHTESSHRFERGADPEAVVRAADRCAQILADIAGGEVAKGILDAAQRMESPPEITLRLERIERLLGLPIAAESVVELLEPLEIRCVARTESSLRFAAPSFRPDLRREVDLIEEVARRRGYDAIDERLPDASGDYRYEPPRDNVENMIRQALLAAGCSEAVHYGFGSPAHFAVTKRRDGEAVKLLNPLGEELSVLRTTLLPGLLQTLARNQRQGVKHVRLFEIGRTWNPRQPQDGNGNGDPRSRVLPREQARLGCLLFGGRHAGRWYEGDQSVDFSDLAGLLEDLAHASGLSNPLRREAGESPGFNAHGCAVLLVGDEPVGVAGQVHPDYLACFDAAGPVYAAELSVAALQTEGQRERRFLALPKYPSTRRDVAVIAERVTPAGKIQAFLRDNAGGTMGPGVVEEVRLFDVYSGDPIPASKVSLAFAIDYRSRDKTLTDDEVGEAFASLLKKLKAEFDIELRE